METTIKMSTFATVKRMTMICFDSDYMEGAHPRILDRLAESNFEQTTGYGTDAHTENAKRLIRKACGCPDAEVFFLVGGTQTNATVIDGLLRHWQGVLAAPTAHINVHEAGAIEAGGHKVITIEPDPEDCSKLTAEGIAATIKTFSDDPTCEHMVAPGMVYISHPTEYGSLYTLGELEAISAVCRDAGIPLFMDGARLGYALASPANDAGLKDIARLCDIFYIGGTKVGALFGEAVVMPQPGLIPHFTTLIKRHCGLLAKGRLLGIQFEVLFSDDDGKPLYVRTAENAINTAARLKEIFLGHGIELYMDSPTNQQFFLLPNDVIKRLMEAGVSFEQWGPLRESVSPVRFVTSWATPPESVERLNEILDDAVKI